MSGAPDFFYREAQRLGYLARSAFKLLQLQDKYKLIKPGSTVLDLGCAPGAWLQVACQSLGPLNNGGFVLGIDLKVIIILLSVSGFIAPLLFQIHSSLMISPEQKVKVPSSLCDSRVQTVSADVMSLPNDQIRCLSPKQKGFSVILSDMCPLVSGIKTKDAALSTELGMRALSLAVGERYAFSPSDDDGDDESMAETESCSSSESGVLLPGGNLVVKLLESEDKQDFNRVCKPLFKKSSWLRPKATRHT